MHFLAGIQVGGSCTESVATQVDMVSKERNAENEEMVHDCDDEVPVPHDDPDYSPLDELSEQYVISPFLVITCFIVGANDKLV